MCLCQTNMTSLVEHIYTKFYEPYKDECELVFEAIRLRYEDAFGAPANPNTHNLVLDKIKFVQQNGGMDDDEEMYWEKEEEPAELFVPPVAKPSRPSEVRGSVISLGCRWQDVSLTVVWPLFRRRPRLQSL